MKKITIAIDGHSSCGKSTMAKALARRIGYVYVDTGAMYRAVTLYALRHGMIDADGRVDELFDRVKQELISMISADAACGQQGLDLLMVAKYLERIGDHATNVAEWVEYSITGIHPSNN